MIGEGIRKNYRSIVTKVLKKFFDREDLYDVLPPKRLDKIIDVTVMIGQFLLSIAFFLAVVSVFLRFVYPSIGFEKTIIVMLAAIMFIIRSYLEAQNRAD